MTKDIVVDFNHVYVSVRGRTVLEDISFAILQGSFTGIIGPNGAGKTTLLRLILGLLEPDRGQVRVFGENPVKLNRKKHRVGYLPQKPQFDRRFPASVGDVVLMGTAGETGLFRLPGRKQRMLADEIMARVGILELKNRPIGELSGGQQQLAFLAGALASRPSLLILDEPTTGLDPGAQNNFYKLVKEAQSKTQLTVIAVSHDLAAISANAHRLICINKTMHIHGSPGEVMEKLSGDRPFRCEFDIIFGSNGWRKQA
ncbi:ABC transporter ATP-binding protein [Desulfallas sp. Bu1-1]|jgi:zinc transport system ATP-binding protein|uniref:metal ABC transporter ATP-binding protein n=1 Tax=Desulfallas sp. Bu1-1 TaxID=2787620 RepID=UPI0018A08083|nr:ABC transporter ATP-binding protein [Desulfallas sp. Bu1-1]MBF7084479.1 ABC transporter ATP-binding protein [Desulfallas sp. Bu1-1]